VNATFANERGAVSATPVVAETERYSRRHGAPAPSRGPAYDAETPVPGCYRIRLRAGGPPVALRIWRGPSIDPATGEEVQERGHHWQCAVNGGERVPVEQYWPGCARDPISQAEHDRLAAAATTMDPDDAFYDPRKPIDRLTAPMPF
jgi:hypothetical protein